LCNAHSLYGEIFVELGQSSAVCLPSLKRLQLDIGNVDVNAINILLSACPVLETLKLSFSTESLAKLRVPSSLKSFEFTVENEIEVCLEIDTPGLKYLSLTDITIGDATSVGNLHNVEEAYLDVVSSSGSESVDPLLTLLQALSGVKCLVFSCNTTMVSAIFVIHDYIFLYIFSSLLLILVSPLVVLYVPKEIIR
jgi:hypothetical protein